MSMKLQMTIKYLKMNRIKKNNLIIKIFAEDIKATKDFCNRDETCT